MSHSNPNPNPHRRFATPQSLSDWLKHRLPSDSFASWGVKPGTKNVHNLFLELSEGETTLINDNDDSSPPELSDGTVRDRNRPLSEKMKPGETLEAAVARAVREELGSVIGDGDGVVRIVPDSYVKKVEERVSVSYPGLPARYVLHSVDAVVDGLPDGDFCTEEGAEYEDAGENRVADAAISCKKHYWRWVDANAV
ncbi:hypothetical protein RHMOL_Rhmol03G0238000 [Rhododendron molle]|uniref:Uncharacterized protein n=2 Tax=Rhododendron molle TaxID=49168 RepID=A0ACC0PJ34_RHOML|nr:hypothetical protein RHMOL_Rhmol03G0238000 [Rhododendron molle]KAI8565146.1 hypothetical protein RHMOL_Rhmol03G0238000 [Rhododendron molle]